MARIMADLPLEPLANIFSFFALNHRIVVLRLVCRQWNACVEADLRSQAILYFAANARRRNRHRLRIFPGYTAAVDKEPWCHHDAQIEARLERYMTKQSLTKDADWSTTSEFFLNHCPNLRAVRLDEQWCRLTDAIVCSYGVTVECLHAPCFELTADKLISLKACVKLRYLAVQSIEGNNLFIIFPLLTSFACRRQDTRDNVATADGTLTSDTASDQH